MLDSRQPSSANADSGESRDSGGSQPSAPAENAAPTVSLPKGGGAIRGIGEKFTANPVTGTGNLTIPIAVSPGRAGFGPALALTYDSGAGNGPFGLGWSLSLPAITRRTDKGLPRYQDAQPQDAIESDIFILSGAEDLVRTLAEDAQGNWAPQAPAERGGYFVTQYRPRIEGLFSRIERWTRASDGDTYWRSISRSNVTTFYGRTPGSRIADPSDPLRVFSWLVCESFDDKGNAMTYEYVAEDSANVEASLANEQNRTPASRSSNRYPKRIRYGNTPSRLVEPDLTKLSWLFEVVFDYGEGHLAVAKPDAEGREFAQAFINGTQPWPLRQDPFSRYRSTFEVRTYRLCRRVLMFHHFPDELGVADTLVRSTDFTYQEGPVASLITQVTQSGFVVPPKASDPKRYLKRSLPPVELEYTEAKVDPSVREVDPESLENLPAGVDGLRYRWLDLDGEGLAGVLAESNDAWYYKRNLSPLTFAFQGDQPTSSARFEPLVEVAKLPGFAKASARASRHHFLDLAGDGQLDCVVLERPTPGFYKRTQDEDWEAFTALESTPNVNFNDPNLRFIDVDGDGHADILITEDDVFTWFASLAQVGFAGGVRVPKPRDEEEGPAVLFADATQSIFLADMSGDGLTDIVRIRNGEICYWANLGYGQFGPKVAMDWAPYFEAPDLFDPRRVRLADIDGSGTIDIVYLASEGVRLYFNQAGNGWSAEAPVIPFPAVDRLSSVQAVDLLGNGTACLVWTSPLPGDAGHVMRYVDLMGGQKPYLLTCSRNNLGAETRVHYAPSTTFYLQDREAGHPWATRLPFPVHVVERVETWDWISSNRFVTRYRYHHGHYDGFEREFRGFGMVEQQDTEELGALEATGTFPASTNIDAASYVPPVRTKTWFHTGAYPHGGRVSKIYEGEYYREPNLSDEQLEAMQLPDTVLPTEIATGEIREAIRSLKGAVLRTEVYAVDGTEAAERPYSVSEQNYTVKRVQPFGDNRHAVFFTHARESIDFHYERTLFDVGGGVERADPRVTHAMVLAVDEYGNATQSVAIAYGRRYEEARAGYALQPADLATQGKTLVTSTENDFTNAILDADAYRTPLPAEIRTYEIVGLAPDTTVADVTRLFGFEEMRGKLVVGAGGLQDLPYEDMNATGTYRRVVEHARTLYRANDLKGDLAPGVVESLALSGASYKRAFTPGLLALFTRKGQNLLLPDAPTVLAEGGYVRTEDVFPKDAALFGHWWIPTGRAFFSPGPNEAQELATATQHFFLPRCFQDPFLNCSTVVYDPHDLLLLQAEDALHNQVTVGERGASGSITNGNDYRVLQPARLMDPNGNRAAVAFDGLGLVVGTAVMGKTTEKLGDSLTGFTTDLTQTQTDGFFADPKGQAAGLLGDATSRIVYDVTRFQRWRQAQAPQPSPALAAPPPGFGATIVRETHATAPGGASSAVQVSLSYSDGFGREIQRKAQAEPGPLVLGGLTVKPRWVASSWTIFNNKGKPVRQYEPFFDDTHEFKFGVTMGVSPILFYDPVGRVVVTVHPDHTWEKVVFDPWRQESWDANDTVAISDPKTDDDVMVFFERIPDADYLPSWYDTHSIGAVAERDAAAKALAHAATPTTAYADTLGRTFLTVAFNRTPGPQGEERLATRLALDIEGNQRKVRDAIIQQGDALGRIVMRYAYDMLGHRVSQLSMEAGARWMLNDVAGKPIRAWNDRLYDFRTEYDPLRRPLRSFVSGGDGGPKKENETFSQPVLFQRTIYGEQYPTPEATNLCGRVFLQLDCAGAVRSGGPSPGGSEEAYDFKGNLLRGSRRLTKLPSGPHKATVDWTAIDKLLPAGELKPAQLAALEKALDTPLEKGSYETSGTFDALNRPLTSTAPDGSVGAPTFNEANLLERLGVNLRGAAAQTMFVRNIVYDAKGRRTRIDVGQKAGGGVAATTEYTYDPATFRLASLTTKRVSPPTDFAKEIFQNPTALQALSYTYDPVGNITQIADAALLTTFHKNVQVDPTCVYTYDAIYRLLDATGRELIGQADVDTSASNPTLRDFPFTGLSLSKNDLQAVRSYTESYVYDGVGNILEMKHAVPNGGWTRSYAYRETSLVEDGTQGTLLKQSNRLSNTIFPVSTQETYGYDAHGNMQLPHLSIMGWDFRDQLGVSQRQVVKGVVGERTYYVYDGSGQRVRKVTERNDGTRKTERIYLGGYEVYREYDTKGTTTLERQTLHVSDDTRRVALVETKTIGGSGGGDAATETLIRYQFDNHLGSASLEVDGHGAVISYEEYLPYGESAFQVTGASAIEISAKRYRYTGMERDEETGLSYHAARYYAPWVGRWTAPDPSVLHGGRADANLYAYVRGNPIVALDPSGFDDKKPGWLERQKVGWTAFSTQLLHRLGAEPSDVSKEVRAEQKKNAALALLNPLTHAIVVTEAIVDALTPKPVTSDPQVTGKQMGDAAADLVIIWTAGFEGKKGGLSEPPKRGGIAGEVEINESVKRPTHDVPTTAKATETTPMSTVGSAAADDPTVFGDHELGFDQRASVKSVRRYSERLVSGRTTSPDASLQQAANTIAGDVSVRDYTKAGQGFHSMASDLLRPLEGPSFKINRNLDTPSGRSLYRRPDFHLLNPEYRSGPNQTREILDLKLSPRTPSSPLSRGPDAFRLSPQFRDIQGVTGTPPTPFYYRLRLK